MEHAKKMILIDPRALSEVRESAAGPPVPDATSTSLREMDLQMRDILERNDMDLEDKANMYQQILRRYRHRFDQYANKPIGTVTMTPQATHQETDQKDSHMPKLEKEVLESVPKTMKQKAQRLMQQLQNHPDLKWNERGELVFNDQVIRHSNIVDLVHDVIRKRKHSEPLGWKTFSKALNDLNVPRDLIGNPERWNFMRSQITPTPTVQSGPVTPKTPQRNIALASIERSKRELAEEDSTPLRWRTAKAKKKRRKERKRIPEDWETV